MMSSDLRTEVNEVMVNKTKEPFFYFTHLLFMKKLFVFCFLHLVTGGSDGHVTSSQLSIIFLKTLE